MKYAEKDMLRCLNNWMAGKYGRKIRQFGSILRRTSFKSAFAKKLCSL